MPPLLSAGANGRSNDSTSIVPAESRTTSAAASCSRVGRSTTCTASPNSARTASASETLSYPSTSADEEVLPPVRGISRIKRPVRQDPAADGQRQNPLFRSSTVPFATFAGRFACPRPSGRDGISPGRKARATAVATLGRIIRSRSFSEMHPWRSSSRTSSTNSRRPGISTF